MKTIDEAKKFLRANFEEGTECPCCGQRVQLYKYKMFATSALALLYLYRLDKKYPAEGMFHVSKYAEAIKNEKIRSPHFAELRFWGLIYGLDHKTKEANSSGYWGITKKGREFVEDKISVPQYVRIFNNKCVRLEGSDITIKDALTNKFDYEELMKK